MTNAPKKGKVTGKWETMMRVRSEHGVPTLQRKREVLPV